MRAWRARAVVEAPAALSAGVLEADDADEDIDAELYPLRCFDGRCAVVNGVQAGVQCVALPPQDNGASSELAEWPWAVPRQFAASGGQDGLLRIWDVESGAELQKIRFGPKVKKSGKAKKGVSGCWVTGVALARPRDACSRPLAFSGSSDGAVVIWAACSVEDSSAAPSSFFSQAMGARSECDGGIATERDCVQRRRSLRGGRPLRRHAARLGCHAGREH